MKQNIGEDSISISIPTELDKKKKSGSSSLLLDNNGAEIILHQPIGISVSIAENVSARSPVSPVFEPTFDGTRLPSMKLNSGDILFSSSKFRQEEKETLSLFGDITPSPSNRRNSSFSYQNVPSYARPLSRDLRDAGLSIITAPVATPVVTPGASKVNSVMQRARGSSGSVKAITPNFSKSQTNGSRSISEDKEPLAPFCEDDIITPKASPNVLSSVHSTHQRNVFNFSVQNSNQVSAPVPGSSTASARIRQGVQSQGVALPPTRK